MANRSQLRRALLILLLVALCILLYLPFRHEKTPGAPPAGVPVAPPPVLDTAAHAPVGEPPAGVDTLPVRSPRSRKAAAIAPPVRYRPASLDAEPEVFEFIRDFYGDVKERWVSLGLAGSRLDSAAPSRRVLRGGIAGEAGWPVKRFLLSVDSVRPLRVYVFPGWSYGSDWAPLPDGSFRLEGNVAPVPGRYLLAVSERRDPIPGAVERRNDRLGLHIRSIPGYAYVLRFGLECEARGGEDSSFTLYAHEVAVGFP
ncbi:MAG TPA: hypothetical protein VMF59_11695, partial [Bacteroidota bacterium]|nr:hypothetical protein [Bacteroidota bacterium]